jgi:fibronectin-binding autotransporter adhesin
MGSVSTTGPRVRALTALAALAAVLAAPAAASAQTFTWTLDANGSWQTTTNWAPTGVPDTTGETAIFGNAATAARTVSLTNLTVGQISFADVNSNSLTAAYTVGTSAQTITLNNGTGGVITVSGGTITNQTIATAVTSVGPLSITNNGAPGVTTLTLSGPLSASAASTALNVDGRSNTTISGAIGNTFGTLTKSGTGVLTLSAANAYTGGTVINGGTVRFTNNNQLGAAAGGVTLNGGALHVAADIFVDRNITLGASGGTILTTAGTGASNPTFRNPISGAGQLTIDGGFYVDFTANNNYSGATVINNAGLRLHSGGVLSATSSVTVNGYVGGQIGILTLDNATGAVNANRVADGASITLNGGMIAGVVGIVTSANEALGDLAVKGFGSLNATQFNGGLAQGSMTFNNITRADNFSTLYVGGPVFGPATGGVNYQFRFTNGLTNPGGTNQTIGIIPWIGGDRGKLDASSSAFVPTNYASTLYTFNATDGLVALDPAGSTHFFQVTAGSAFNGPVPGAKNNAITGNPLALNSGESVTILSLVQNPSSGASAITGASNSTLTVSSGAIANVNTMSFNGPTLNFGANTGYLWLGHEFVVMGTSRITGTNGLVVSSNSDDGRNGLYLINTAGPNAFTGGLYLNGTARVAFDTADSQLGAAGEKISFRGGTLRYIGGTSTTLATAGTNRPIEMYAAGGGMISVETAGVTLTVPGVVSGTEQLTAIGPGTLALTNTTNSFAGGLTVGNATVAVAGPGSLGTGNLTLGVQIGTTTYSGGTLRFDGAGTYAANVNHAFSTTLNTNGNSVTLSGVVSGNGTTLTKTGAGTVTFTGANTYTANTVVSAGTLLANNSTGSGTGYGSVTVASGATLGGTGTVAGPVTVNSGGKLAPGAANGLGTLTVLGKTTLANGSTFQATLNGASAGQFGQLVIAPGASIDIGSTAAFAATLGYTPQNSDKIFVVNNQNAAGGLTGTFTNVGQGQQYTFADGTKATVSYTGDFATSAITGGNDLVLYNFQPVPEPATVLGIAALALGGGMAWRRRKAGADAGATA